MIQEKSTFSFKLLDSANSLEHNIKGIITKSMYRLIEKAAIKELQLSADDAFSIFCIGDIDTVINRRFFVQIKLPDRLQDFEYIGSLTMIERLYAGTFSETENFKLLDTTYDAFCGLSIPSIETYKIIEIISQKALVQLEELLDDAINWQIAEDLSCKSYSIQVQITENCIREFKYHE